MKENIVSVRQRTYVNGDVEETFDYARQYEYSESDKSDYSEEALLSWISKELIDYATTTYPENFEENVLRYCKNKSTFVFEYTKVNDNCTTFFRNIYLTPSHIVIEERSHVRVPGQIDISVNHEWYIEFKDGKYIYTPRNHSVSHYKGDNIFINTETDFEGGWSHSYSSLGAIEKIKAPSKDKETTTLKRYVGVDNPKEVAFTDIESKSKDGKLLSEKKEFHVLNENSSFTIKSDEFNYYYNN